MAREREDQILCPYCGHRYENEDYSFVTTWGEGDEHRGEVQCGSCDKEFWVEEHVQRTWSTYTVRDLAEGKP